MLYGNSPMTKRVGILGGTFDPPHIGHLVVADQVLDQLGLDEVRLMVSNQSWQKVGERTITPAAQRLALVDAALEGSGAVVPSALEIELGGPSHTLVTLEALIEREPGVEWLVVVGADAAAGLDTWHRADELRARHRFVMVNRPGRHQPPPPGWSCEELRIPSLEVSSSEIRRLVARDRSVRYLTPDPVVRLVRAWGLYRSEP
jgi:nicotinate-nucleotide adenylyltransferase